MNKVLHSSVGNYHPDADAGCRMKYKSEGYNVDNYTFYTSAIGTPGSTFTGYIPNRYTDSKYYISKYTVNSNGKLMHIASDVRNFVEK